MSNWLDLASAVVAAMASIAAAWIGARAHRAAKAARTEAVSARESAAEAADLARPTGNGWAGHMEDNMQGLRRDVSSLLSGMTALGHGAVRLSGEISHIGRRLDEAIADRERTDAEHDTRIRRLEHRTQDPRKESGDGNRST